VLELRACWFELNSVKDIIKVYESLIWKEGREKLVAAAK
jgi:hypothetical protein